MAWSAKDAKILNKWHKGTEMQNKVNSRSQTTA